MVVRDNVRKNVKVEYLHPQKTFIRCIQKGFAFLGIQWNKVPEISKQSIVNHPVKLAQRYAQNAVIESIGEYLKRWNTWCQSMLKCCRNEQHPYLYSSCNKYQGDSYEKCINKSNHT